MASPGSAQRSVSEHARPGPALPVRPAPPDRCGPRDTLSALLRSGQIEICHTSSSSRLSVIDAGASDCDRSFVRSLSTSPPFNCRSVSPPVRQSTREAIHSRLTVSYSSPRHLQIHRPTIRPFLFLRPTPPHMAQTKEVGSLSHFGCSRLAKINGK